MADLKEAYNGFSNIVDTRQKCCGAQFNNMRYYVPIGGKQVSIQQLKNILKRNKALRLMGMKPHQSIWDELNITKQQYQQVKSKLRK